MKKPMAHSQTVLAGKLTIISKAPDNSPRQITAPDGSFVLFEDSRGEKIELHLDGSHGGLLVRKLDKPLFMNPVSPNIVRLM